MMPKKGKPNSVTTSLFSSRNGSQKQVLRENNCQLTVVYLARASFDSEPMIDMNMDHPESPPKDRLSPSSA